MAAEAQVPRGQEHVQARTTDRRFEIAAAQRNGRPAGLWQRATRKVEEPAWSVSVDSTPGPFARRDRQTALLEVPRRCDRRFQQVHRARATEPRRPDALEGARSEVAFCPQGIPA